MKKIILLLAIVFLSNLLFGQNETFNRYLGEGRSVFLMQLPDNDFLITGKSDSAFILIRTDYIGSIKWKKVFTGYVGNRVYGAKSIDNNSIIVALNKPTDGINKPYLCKFDVNGNILWEKSFSDFYSGELCNAVEIAPDSGFYLVSTNSNSSSRGVILRKTDADGNLLWTRFYAVNINSALYHGSNIVISGNNIFIQPKNYKFILKLNLNGDSIWTKTFNNIQWSIAKYGTDHLIIGSQNLLQKTDKECNSILNIAVGSQSVYSVAASSNGNLICGTSAGNVMQFDSIGSSLFTINVGFSPYYITQLSDISILSTGEKINFLKTNLKLSYLSLDYPAGGERLLPKHESSIVIKWNYALIPETLIKILFTSNNGANWILVSDTTLINAYYYKWKFPYTYSDNCRIKIITSDESFSNTSGKFNLDTSIISGKNDYYSNINTNNIKMWFANNGVGSHDPNNDASGLYWPHPYNLTATFQDGLVIGGIIDGNIRVNGSTHRTGFQAGVILPGGVADNPNNPRNQIYKIRKDWESLPLSHEKDFYEFSYKNWPFDQGAPYEDINNNGIYDPNIDKPKHLGDETCFYVANDLDTNRSTFTYGSYPIGLEFQTTVYAFKRNNFLGDCVFKKYKIINKSGRNVTDFYISYWSDDDLGYESDDYVGCDTTINMAFTWNSNNNDYFYGAPSPAVAHQFVQTPVVSASSSDSARVGNGWRKGYKNISLSSFIPLLKAYGIFKDPSMGVYNGTIEMYNNMKGKSWNGQDLIDPLTNQPVRLLLYGDPETGTGWYEGTGWPGGPPAFDRRHLISTGPVNFAPNDTQEVVIAIFAARGNSNLNSVTKLKQAGRYLKDVHNLIISDVLEGKEIPEKFYLYNNYPNPFNTITKINYTLPVNGKVRLKIYDILGREVETLVDEQRQAGKYTTDWNAEKFSSGIYFYELTVGNDLKSFRTIKKMALLK